MNLVRSIPTLLGLLFAGTSLSAHHPVPPPRAASHLFVHRAEHRQVHQQRRITHGLHAGQLTPREAARLQHQQVRIDYRIAQAEADGRVTMGEAARIHHRQEAASRRIFRKKHNGRMTL